LPRKPDIFYGWIVAGAALGIGAALFGIRFSFGVFFESFQSEFALTRAVTSSVYSLYLVSCSIFGIIGGWAMDRYHPRLVAAFFGVSTGISLLLISQAGSLWQLYVTYGLLLAAGTGAPVPTMTSVVARWFDRRRGLAIGISASGTGLGIVLVAPLAAYLITLLGWRMAYVGLAVFIFIMVISLAMLLRRDPAEMGLLPDGARQIQADELTHLPNGRPAAVQRDSLMRSILRSRIFWAVGGIRGIFGICVSMIMTHLVPYATDVGLTTIEAAMVLSVASGIQVASQMSVGGISDAIGRKIPGIICAIIGIGAFLWLAQSTELWMFYLFALLFGLSWGGANVINLTIVSDAFKGSNLGLVLGLQTVFWTAGNAIGSLLGGLVFDATGSYTIAFGTAAAGMLLVIFLYTITRTR